VEALAKRYLREHAIPKKKPSSVTSDQQLLDNHVIPKLGRLRVAEVTRNDVSALHHSLRKTPYQANHALSLISKMMNLAERWGLREDGTNPCRHVERYREHKRERYLSAAETARLGDALTALVREEKISKSCAAAVRLIALTGARRGEVCGLRWEYIDWERACLRLPDSKTGPKVIPLAAPALQLLANLPRRSEWCFPTEQGDLPADLSRPWDRIREQAKLPGFRIHDLRHTCASVLAAQGESLIVIGKLLGHTVPATTARYAHLSDDPVRAAAERVGAQIARALSGSGAPESAPAQVA
jgi:integrase